MSWQSYIDQSLLGTGQVAKAAIHGLDGSPWATSNGFKVTPEQVQKIVNAFNSGTLAEFYTSGMYIGTETTEGGTEQEIKYKFIKQNGKAFYVKEGDTGACVFKTNTSGLFIGDEADNKYKFLRQNESSIYVKKGEAGACVYLTKSCIIFGVYSEGMQGGNCNNVVEKLGDYLRGSGY